MFTHIDAAHPERQFSFGVYVDDDDTYAGAGHDYSPCRRVCRGL